MIRLLTQQDISTVQPYLDKDPLHNVYLIHSLQTHGLESNLVSFWGAFGNEQLTGVLLVDKGYRRPFGSLAADDPGVALELGKTALKAGVRELRGKSIHIQPLVENLPAPFLIHRMEHLLCCEVRPGQLQGRYDYPVHMATQDDIPMLVQLYHKAYGLDKDEVERDIIRRTMDEGGECFFVKWGDLAVSAIRIFPQTDLVGMVDAGITLPQYRGRGIYLSVYTACHEHLSRNGKIGVALISETNTIMHKIIDKYGGTFTDRWLLVRFRRKPPLRRRVIPTRLRSWILNLKRFTLRQGRDQEVEESFSNYRITYEL